VNVLCLTQARSLDMFHGLASALGAGGRPARAGYYVADRAYWRRFVAAHPSFPSEAPVACEWDVMARAANGSPDLGALRAMEERLGDPVLWNALVADRRVSLGRNATFRQEYRPRYDYDRMLRILEETAAALERLFDEVRPDVVLSFICVTVGDYLGYRIARARGIPFLNLRPTRIANYVHAADTVHEPSPRITAAYEARRALRRADEWQRRAVEYLERVRAGDARYEGVLEPPEPAPSGGLFARAARLARAIRERYGPEADRHHDPEYLRALWHSKVVGPIRRRRATRLCAEARGRDRREYVLFPLHTEPEVTLLVYSPACRNQIEIVRNLARSLPAGMEVWVKEHPAALGKRPPGYYRRLLEIPNVRLVEAGLPSRPLVEGARLIATIAGSIGLEAAFRARPVLLFGHAPYEILPPSMVRRVSDLDAAPEDVSRLLSGHRHDESALVDYVAAVMGESVPVDLYSRLLRRPDVYSARGRTATIEQEREADLRALADYVLLSLPPRAGAGSPLAATVDRA
jgi:Capsule polysaccharide biosynthesis protein